MLPLDEQTALKVADGKPAVVDRPRFDCPQYEVSVPQFLVRILRVPSEECRFLAAVSESQHLAPSFREQFMQGGGDNSVRSIGAVHDLLNRVTDAAAPVLARFASLQLVGVVLVVRTPPHAGRRFASAGQRHARQRAAATAQKLVSILGRQVILYPEVRMTRIADGLPQLSVPNSTDVVMLTTLLAQGDFQRLRARTILVSALAVQHHRVLAVSVHQKRTLESPQERVVAAWRPLGGSFSRFAEDDAACGKGLSE